MYSGTEMSSEIATRNEQWPVLVRPKSGVSPGVRNARSLFYVYTTALSTLFDFYLAPIARAIMHDIATSAKWATSVFLSSCATMAPKFKSVCENVGERHVQLPSKSSRRRCRAPRQPLKHVNARDVSLLRFSQHVITPITSEIFF